MAMLAHVRLKLRRSCQPLSIEAGNRGQASKITEHILHFVIQERQGHYRATR